MMLTAKVSDVPVMSYVFQIYVVSIMSVGYFEADISETEQLLYNG